MSVNTLESSANIPELSAYTQDTSMSVNTPRIVS